MVSNIFYFQPYLGKIPILTNIFQMGWNHQLEIVGDDASFLRVLLNFGYFGYLNKKTDPIIPSQSFG